MACDSSYIGDDDAQDASMTKITRLSSGALLGGAGDSDDRDVIALFDKVKSPKQFPTRKQLAELALNYVGILVLPSGRIFKIYTTADPNPKDDRSMIWECNRGMAAAGSGAHLALGNMTATASAVEGVKAACKWNPYCRLPVHSVELRQKKRKKK